MELTLSIQGSPAEIRDVLDALERAGRSPTELTDRRLHRFVHHASPPMLAVIKAVAAASAQEEAITRPQLMAAIRTKEESELNGVLGSIGRAWARVVGGDNPFLGADGPEGGVAYRIDSDLARRILPLTESWTPGGGRGRRRGRPWADDR